MTRPFSAISALAIVFVTAACGDSASDPSTTTTITSATTTTTEATTTIATTSTTTAPTTTTSPSTTTTTVPAGPSAVQGLTVGLGGGSLEVAVTWDANPEADISHYNVYFSESPGGAKTYVRSVSPSETVGSKVGFIDYPRDQTEGQTCYIVRAVSTTPTEGPPSSEACFDSSV